MLRRCGLLLMYLKKRMTLSSKETYIINKDLRKPDTNINDRHQDQKRQNNNK